MQKARILAKTLTNSDFQIILRICQACIRADTDMTPVKPEGQFQSFSGK